MASIDDTSNKVTHVVEQADVLEESSLPSRLIGKQIDDKAQHEQSHLQCQGHHGCDQLTLGEHRRQAAYGKKQGPYEHDPQAGPGYDARVEVARVIEEPPQPDHHEPEWNPEQPIKKPAAHELGTQDLQWSYRGGHERFVGPS